MEGKSIFLIALSLVALAGVVLEAFHLLSAFYFWTLVRLVGHGSLFAYALLMLRHKGYNNRSLAKEEPE